MSADKLCDFPDQLESIGRPFDIHDAEQASRQLSTLGNNTSGYANSFDRPEPAIHNGHNRTLLLGVGLIH